MVLTTFLIPGVVGVLGILGGMLKGLLGPNPPTPRIIKDIVLVNTFFYVFAHDEVIVKTTSVILPLSTTELMTPVLFKSVSIYNG